MTPVHIVAQEHVGRARYFAAGLEEGEEVVELAMEVTADVDRGSDCLDTVRRCWCECDELRKSVSGI